MHRLPRRSALVLLCLAVLAGAVVAQAYREEMQLRRERPLADSALVVTARGTIEYAEWGDGPAVLVIHGAGGRRQSGLATSTRLPSGSRK